MKNNEVYNNQLISIKEDIELLSDNLSIEEKYKYYEIIMQCMEYCKTIYPVKNKNIPLIVQLKINRNEDYIIEVNGCIKVGKENRLVSSAIDINNNVIEVSTEVTRLAYDGENKNYTVIDTFTYENDKKLHDYKYITNSEKSIKK